MKKFRDWLELRLDTRKNTLQSTILIVAIMTFILSLVIGVYQYYNSEKDNGSEIGNSSSATGNSSSAVVKDVKNSQILIGNNSSININSTISENTCNNQSIVDSYTRNLRDYAKIKSCIKFAKVSNYNKLYCIDSGNYIDIFQSFKFKGAFNGEEIVVESKYSGKNQ